MRAEYGAEGVRTDAPPVLRILDDLKKRPSTLIRRRIFQERFADM